MLAIMLGTLAAAHFFIAPETSLWIENLPDLVQLIIYVFVNCVAVLLFDRVERERNLAESRSAENERLSDDLRQADIRKDEFLALLAHELRNPLAPIRSSLILLEQKFDSPEVVRRVRDVIHRQTSHLIRLTEDLLDVSRYCQGHVELQTQRLDVRIAIEDAIEMVDESFQTKSQRFESLLPEHPVWVDGDRVRLAQLIANLLGNASKYTPESGRVVLNLDQVDDSLSIVVTDNGIGFDPDQAQRILEPFVQIDGTRTREYGGLGVGLTIVSRLATLHGGQLSASSRGPGMGSCFSVTLPAAPPPINQEEHRRDEFERIDSPAIPGHAFHDSLKKKESTESEVSNEQKMGSLLLVDDNADAVTILADLFRFEGYEVTLAFDGFEAIQQSRKCRPDVVVMDIGLPGMDGYETARRIRRSQLGEGLKLVALTGWGRPTDRALATAAGFDLHLLKPVAFRQLLDHIIELRRQQLDETNSTAFGTRDFGAVGVNTLLLLASSAAFAASTGAVALLG
jgi:two-component system CheB/CheR fusion protein